QIEFGGCKDPGDEHAYQGRPHDLLVFDEASQFPERMVRFIAGWLRTTVPGQRCRLLLCFNPPSSAEGDWLLQYFAPWIDDTHPRPAEPAELRWYAMLDGQGNGMLPAPHRAVHPSLLFSLQHTQDGFANVL